MLCGLELCGTSSDMLWAGHLIPSHRPANLCVLMCLSRPGRALEHNEYNPCRTSNVPLFSLPQVFQMRGFPAVGKGTPISTAFSLSLWQKKVQATELTIK